MAFVVGQAIGLDVTDAARDYIQLYRGDGAALAESLGRIQRTAAIVLALIGIDDTGTGCEGSRATA